MKRISEQRKYWDQTLLWLALIYLSIPLLRPATDPLKKFIPYSFFIKIIFTVVLVFVIWAMLKKVRIKDVFTYFLIALLVMAALTILSFVKIPDEKIHFIQYGFLSYLFHRALRFSIRESHAYAIAFFLTGAAGWIDEAIQLITPNRYYDLRDVLFNTLGGLLGLLITFVMRRRGDSREENF